MSGMSRAIELINMGMTQLEAMRHLADETAAIQAGLPVPPLPDRILEKCYGQTALEMATWDDESEEAA